MSKLYWLDLETSIHFDLGFLKEWMPQVASKFSHRLYDVSAINLFALSLGMLPLPKDTAHRAESDVEASIRQGADHRGLGRGREEVVSPPGFMGCVAVESPYAARHPFTLDDHVRYARMCMGDALNRGEAPFLSHLLYTQVLDDCSPSDRKKGMAAGLALSQKLDFAAAYIDLGVSSGMAAAFAHYREIGFRCELRRLFTPQIGEALRAGRLTLKKAGELQ